MSTSLAQLSAEFSVLLAAITHFTIAFFQHNKHSQRVTFSGQFLVWLGKCSLGSKLISGGVAIRMSWCAFFEKINSRGGDVYSGLESICFLPQFNNFLCISCNCYKRRDFHHLYCMQPYLNSQIPYYRLSITYLLVFELSLLQF